MSETAAYLVDDVEVTVRLLDEPLEWRVRAVDELLIDAASSCRHRRSLHCGSIREFLPADLESANAFVAIPVCSMPRGPLLDFDVEGPVGNAWLLPRLEIARRESELLALLAARAGQALDSRLQGLLEALVGFADGALLTADGERRSVPDFVSDGLGVPLTPGEVNQLRRLSAACSSLMKPWSDRPGVTTAPELPALGLPRLIASGACNDVGEGIEAITAYVDLVVSMSKAAGVDGSAEASDFLYVLADYGHNFDLTVATKVPIDEPFTLKFEERRSLDLGRWTNAGRQELIIADANTNHVTFRVEDPNVRIASCVAVAVEPPRRPAYGAFVPRANEQTRSFYCYDDDRDYRVTLEFRLALLRRLMLVPYLIAALLGILAIGLVASNVQGARDIALVAAPTSVAAGVLSARESSTLGSRLRLLNSSLIAGGLAALVLAATLQLVRS